MLLVACSATPEPAATTTDTGRDSPATDTGRDSLPTDTGTPPAPPVPLLADYDNENREAAAREDGYLHVDSPTLVSRLVELGANTYAFLLYHSPSDWDDLAEYLALAEPAGLTTWVYLVPPSEIPRSYPPFEDDYVGTDSPGCRS